MEYRYQSEDQLLDDLKRGKEEAISYAYREYWSMSISHILKNSGKEEDAGDFYQEIFLIFLDKIKEKSFVRKSKLSTFFMGILKNQWLNELRKKKVQIKKMDEYLKEQETNPEEDEFDLPSHEEIQVKFNGLDDLCKNILIDSIFNKLSANFIAEKYDLASEDAARQKKFKCLKKLKSFFQL